MRRLLMEAATACLIVALVVLAIRQQTPPWTLRGNELLRESGAAKTWGYTDPVPATLVVGCKGAEVRSMGQTIPVPAEHLEVETLVVKVPPDRLAPFDLTRLDRSLLHCP